MKKIFALIILFTAVNYTYGQVKQTVAKSEITFKVKNMGFNTGGEIGGLQANITFDKDKPEASSIQGTVDVSAINTDNDARDNHLKSADYFDVAKYPKMTMKSVSIKHRSGNNYTGSFYVTIKDKTKLLDVPFTYTQTGNTGEFKGSFKILRTEFGIGDSSMVLANEVTVIIDIQTTQ